MSTSAYNPGFMYSNSLPNTGITAKQSMQYQEYLANTSHQRQMADLKAAGLNPWLADVSGAATPTGQTDSADVLGVLSGAVSALSSAVGKGAEEESDILNILMALGMRKSQAEAIASLADQYGIHLTLANAAAFARDPMRYIENQKNSAKKEEKVQSTSHKGLTGVFTENGKKVYRIDGRVVTEARYKKYVSELEKETSFIESSYTHSARSRYHDANYR